MKLLLWKWAWPFLHSALSWSDAAETWEGALCCQEGALRMVPGTMAFPLDVLSAEPLL